jgi:serine phosphatase RsbU (regulator of sigma subunit)
VSESSQNSMKIANFLNFEQSFILQIQLFKPDNKYSTLWGGHICFIVNTLYAFNGQETLSLIIKSGI